jgi:hypothetical protein
MSTGNFVYLEVRWKHPVLFICLSPSHSTFEIHAFSENGSSVHRKEFKHDRGCFKVIIWPVTDIPWWKYCHCKSTQLAQTIKSLCREDDSGGLLDCGVVWFCKWLPILRGLYNIHLQDFKKFRPVSEIPWHQITLNKNQFTLFILST